MTHQEFYETHFLIDGKKPPPLYEWQKKVLQAYDKAAKMPGCDGIIVCRGRQYGMRILFEALKAKAEFEEQIHQ